MEEKDDIFRFEDFLGGDKIEDLKRMKSNLLNEGLFNEDEDEEDEEVDPKFNPYKNNYEQSDYLDMDRVADIMSQSYGDAVMNNVEDFEESIYYSGTKDADKYALEFKGYMDMISTGEMTSDDDLDLELVELDPNNTNDEDDEYHLDESKDDNEDYYKLFKDKAEDFICDIAVEGVNQNDTEVRLIVESEDWTLMFTGEIKNGKCIIPIKKLNILNEGQTGNIKLEVNADGNLFTPWEDKYIVKVSKKVTVSLNENKSTKTKKPVKKGLGVKVNVKR